MTDHYAVMGNPIAHSKSPRIHTLFAEQTGAALDYRAILVAIDGFAEAVTDFRMNGGKGLNVTVPFKEQAWALATSRSMRAELAGAVNTLSLEDGKTILGDNTDGAGLVRDLLQNHGARLASQRILLLGAGGAARGVIGPLLDEKPALLVIANRTAEKAVELARLFCELGHTEGCGLGDVAGQPFDIIINATAASLSGTVPAIAGDIVTPGTRCYDMMYGDQPTAFMEWARAQGATQVTDGLGMLVEQAAESFYIWRKVRPDTAPVISALRENHPL
jgi:shikimate dehydrogenase